MHNKQHDSISLVKHDWSLYCTCASCRTTTADVSQRLFQLLSSGGPERHGTKGSSPEAVGRSVSSEGNSLGSSPPAMDVTKSAPECFALGPNGTTNPCKSVGVPWALLPYDFSQYERELRELDELEDSLRGEQLRLKF